MMINQWVERGDKPTWKEHLQALFQLNVYICIYIYIFICLLLVVYGMRLIRRPWKGCQFWDVPFTIPWKGCKFQKWGLRKWGYRIWFFWVFIMLHMLSYDHQRGWGWGVGGGVLTFLTSTSFTLRKMHTLRMLSYDHQGGWGWGVGGVY